jgi:hypothetical protein
MFTALVIGKSLKRHRAFPVHLGICIWCVRQRLPPNDQLIKPIFRSHKHSYFLYCSVRSENLIVKVSVLSFVVS